jgi:uncharacterized membrane protein YdjX (TVP38/TMEM64 family)
MNATGAQAGPRGLTAAANRHAAAVRWVSLAVILLCVLLIVRQLPVPTLIQMLTDRVRGLGLWGPVVFGLVYAAAALLLVPGSALTLTAGALFGLGLGTVVVSVSATASAAAAFLIARHLARDRVARKVRQYPKFDAIDRAISEGGWKIVALLRLSPAVPFGLQNYFYGLTGIRFGTCVLTSWVAMLPGTFMYVYLGDVGRAGLEAAGGGRTRGPAEWALTIVGLVATVAVTVYVTRLARRAIRQYADSPAAGPAETGRPVPQGWPWGATAALVLALAAVGIAVFTQVHPEPFQYLFGNPSR